MLDQGGADLALHLQVQLVGHLAGEEDAGKKTRDDTNRFVSKIILAMQGKTKVAGGDHRVVVLYDHLASKDFNIRDFMMELPTWFV